MFTRQKAIALLTAEKLASGLTDTDTAQLTNSAMDKVRAALRRTDRDHLETFAPHIQVLAPGESHSRQNAYQQLVTAITGQRVVRLSYRAAVSAELTTRDVEPIGLPKPALALSRLLPHGASIP